MPTYRYKNPYNKPMRRTSVVETPMGVRPDGTTLLISQAGPPELIASGTLLTDVRPYELEAFGDQLELVTDAEAAAMAHAQASGEPQEPLYTLAGVHEPSGPPRGASGRFQASPPSPPASEAPVATPTSPPAAAGEEHAARRRTP